MYARRYALPARSAFSVYFAFVLFLALLLGPAFSGREAISPRPLQKSWKTLFLLPLWCSPYLVYTIGTRDFHWLALAKLLAIGIPVLLIYRFIPVRNPRILNWQDVVIALLLVAFVLSGQLKGIWNVPANLDFMSRLFLVAVASWGWVFLRPVPGLGYSVAISSGVLKEAGLNFLYFAAIAIPLGFGLHFIKWNPRWPGLGLFCLNYLEIFFFIALLEELFFRGFLQNLLSNTLGSWVAGQAIVSVLFGFFHILHAPFPNWRYVVLASVAGWFYGSAYRKTGSLMASSLLHAGVDMAWRTWLSVH
ncbi:MAG: CPBP family intramembrane metalloprotease [Acidobacteriota bacterium]|nr:CPBP family intramembrane metalloprotease [Acidobacteriota bacterium]